MSQQLLIGHWLRTGGFYCQRPELHGSSLAPHGLCRSVSLAPENRLRQCLRLSILTNLCIQIKSHGNHYNHLAEFTLNSFVHLMVLSTHLALLPPC